MRLGRFSIPLGLILRSSGLDELPQLLNIIEGSMTFFGPRPLLQSETTREHLEGILAFRKPGFFSYLKTQFPLGASTQKGFLASNYAKPNIAYNRYEMTHWSFAFQIKILFLTVWNVLRGLALMVLGVRDEMPSPEELLKRIGIFPEIKNGLKTERSEASPTKPIVLPAGITAMRSAPMLDPSVRFTQELVAPVSTATFSGMIAKVRSELIPLVPTAPTPNELVRRRRDLVDHVRAAKTAPRDSSSRSEARLTDSEIGVARGATQNVLRQLRVLQIGREMFGKTMDQLMPSAYAMARSEARPNIAKLLTDPVKLESGLGQVSMIFGSIPQKGDPVRQRLVEIMAKSKFLEFQIVVPGAARIELGAFQAALVKEVHKARVLKGGVNLDVTSVETDITRFVGGYPENALVYDMREDDGAALKVLAPDVLKAGRGKQVLSVYSDKGMTLTQRSLGLIASINTLLEQKDIDALKGVQPLSAIMKLAENLQIAIEADKSLASAA